MTDAEGSNVRYKISSLYLIGPKYILTIKHIQPYDI